MSHDPNFLCIGAQKAGTTWLKHMLEAHPDAFVPDRKELYFFSRRSVYAKGMEWYRQQFAGAAGEKAIGELTADYLWTTSDPADLSESDRNSNVPDLIKKHYPDLKFIAILRNPVDRAISAFLHHVRARRISPTADIMDAGTHFGILSMGYYEQHLRNWYKSFDDERFLILLFEDDVKKKPLEGVKSVFQFLDIDDQFEPPEAEKRVHGASNHLLMRVNYYLPWLGQLLKAYPSLMMGMDWKIEISASARQALEEHYRPHNERLAQLLGRELPW